MNAQFGARRGTGRPASRALARGGGGAPGIGREAGLLAEFAAGGVALADADLIVGTLAGSLAGAHLALGLDPADAPLRRRLRRRTRRGATGGRAPAVRVRGD